MDELNRFGTAHLRVARPTDDLGAVVRFYRDDLGFAVLGGFTDYAGFDGVMLGHPGAAYHLECIHKVGHPAGTAPTEENCRCSTRPTGLGGSRRSPDWTRWG